MTYRELRHQLHELRCICDMNQRYHQCMGWRWQQCDRAAKIIVALVACLALAAEFWGPAGHYWAIGFASASAVFAFALNVVPFGEIERTYHALFHGWSELRTDVEGVMARRADGADDDQVPELVHERVVELLTKQQGLCIRESAPCRRLLLRCQEDSNESIWGVRTNAEVEKERQRREKALAHSGG